LTILLARDRLHLQPHVSLKLLIARQAAQSNEEKILRLLSGGGSESTNSPKATFCSTSFGRLHLRRAQRSPPRPSTTVNRAKFFEKDGGWRKDGISRIYDLIWRPLSQRLWDGTE
jgi:hypothetical protein